TTFESTTTGPTRLAACRAGWRRTALGRPRRIRPAGRRTAREECGPHHWVAPAAHRLATREQASRRKRATLSGSFWRLAWSHAVALLFPPRVKVISGQIGKLTPFTGWFDAPLA